MAGVSDRGARVHIRTWGCQMNDLDTGKMRVRLEEDGFVWTDSVDDADVILLNTCSVREKPTHKVRSFLGEIAPLKAKRPDMVVGLAGCYAQQEKGALLKRFRTLDLVMGPDAITRVSDLVREVRSARSRVLDTRFHARQDYPFANELVRRGGGSTAFVTVQKGCDHVCAFCIVPRTRGRQISRVARDVVAECQGLVDAGVREITLLGQNVNSYGVDNQEPPFHQLVATILDEVPDLLRLRFTTSNPWDLSPELIELFGQSRRLAPYFHLPLQSGSDAMLARMKRGHDFATYLDRVDALRAACPEIALSTDIIVGHPGERQADHDANISALNRIGYSFVYSFCYSPRPRTESERMSDDVPDSVKRERLAEIQECQREHTQKFMDAHIGTDVEVLVEGASRRDESWRAGRTPQNTIVNFAGGPELDGSLTKVHIVGASLNSLKGALVGAAHKKPSLPVIEASS